MADLSIEFAGIKAPNPFWLASAPPTDKAYNVVRAFEAGWGGVVWKTLGEDPAAAHGCGRRTPRNRPRRPPTCQRPPPRRGTHAAQIRGGAGGARPARGGLFVRGAGPAEDEGTVTL